MCLSWYDHSLNILWSNLEFVPHNESTWRFCSTSQYRGFLFMSPNKSVFFANKENGTHMFSPACFPWQLRFFSNTYISHSPATDLKSLSQMSTKHFDTGQLPNMTCYLLVFLSCLLFLYCSVFLSMPLDHGLCSCFSSLWCPFMLLAIFHYPAEECQVAAVT